MRGSYTQESCTTSWLHRWWTDLVTVESDCLSLLWQRWLVDECFLRSLDRHRSPSKTNSKTQGCCGIHNRTDKPALWQLTFQLEHWSFQTCHLWPQNTLESDWAICQRSETQTKNTLGTNVILSSLQRLFVWPFHCQTCPKSKFEKIFKLYFEKLKYIMVPC